MSLPIRAEREALRAGESTAAPLASDPAPAARWAMQSSRVASQDCGLPGRAQPPKVSGILEATEPPSFSTRFLRRPVLSAAANLAGLLRLGITDEMHASAAPWVQAMGPRDVVLWLSVHQTTLDFLNLLPLRQALPVPIDLRIASRTFKGKVASRVSGATIDRFLFHVHRPSMGEGATPEQQAAMRAANAETMASVRDGFTRGVHAAMFPEGTTMTDGRIFEVKKGCLDLVRVPQADGSIKVVPVAPVGFTIDMLAGPGGRYLTFVKVADRIVYEPVAPKSGESHTDWSKRDAQVFVDRVRSALLRATTITATQLAGQLMLEGIKGRRYDLDKGELMQTIGKRAAAMSLLGYDVDPALLTPDGLRERVGTLWQNLLKQGYLDEDRKGLGAMNLERVQHEALDQRYAATDPRRYRRYKHENPLRYCANRLLQLMQHDPRVARVCA